MKYISLLLFMNMAWRKPGRIYFPDFTYTNYNISNPLVFSICRWYNFAKGRVDYAFPYPGGHPKTGKAFKPNPAFRMPVITGQIR
jgi:hypothetical protein